MILLLRLKKGLKISNSAMVSVRLSSFLIFMFLGIYSTNVQNLLMDDS